MARTSSGGSGKEPKVPARRRADKSRQASAAVANDGGRVIGPGSMSLKTSDYLPSPADVQRRAYQIYVQRGGGHGRDLDDWYEAERQLKRQ